MKLHNVELRIVSSWSLTYYSILWKIFRKPREGRNSLSGLTTYAASLLHAHWMSNTNQQDFYCSHAVVSPHASQRSLVASRDTTSLYIRNSPHVCNLNCMFSLSRQHNKRACETACLNSVPQALPFTQFIAWSIKRLWLK